MSPLFLRQRNKQSFVNIRLSYQSFHYFDQRYLKALFLCTSSLDQCTRFLSLSSAYFDFQLCLAQFLLIIFYLSQCNFSFPKMVNSNFTSFQTPFLPESPALLTASFRMLEFMPLCFYLCQESIVHSHLKSRESPCFFQYRVLEICFS